MKKTFFSLTAITLVAFGACNKLQELYAPLETEWIRFETGDVEASGTMETKSLENEITCDITDWDYVEEGEQTKAKLTETLSGSVGVYGFNFASWSETLTPTVMSNEKSSFSGSSLTTENKHLWKDCKAEKVRFYAYAPYGKFTVSGKDDAGIPYLTFTVPTDNSKQADILYAQSEDISKDNRNAVPLQFKHAMCAVQFRLGMDDATLNSVTVSNVKNTGKLSLDGTWSNLSGSSTYTISNKDSLLLMIPQTLATGATVTLNYTPKGGTATNISAKIEGTSWAAGKKVVYTLKKKKTDGKDEYIYLDLAIGTIIITENSYQGWVYSPEEHSDGCYREINGTHKPENKYYIYQSRSKAKPYDSSTGYATVEDADNKTNCRVPVYNPIMVGDQTWGDYITNNLDIEGIETLWGTKAADVGRISVGSYKEFKKSVTETSFKIIIHGNSTFDVTIDNLWSKNVGNEYGGIYIGNPDRTKRTYNEKVTLRLKGDNKFHKIYYNKPADNFKGGDYKGYLKITSAEGDGLTTGTLTVTWPNEDPQDGSEFGYLGGLIGAGNASYDEDPEFGSTTRQCDAMYFAGGTIYLGSRETSEGEWNGPTKPIRNHRVCIGGGNAYNNINISGGRLTSVSHSTSAAIGGGGGHNDPVAKSKVTISGGEVYAYSYPVYSTASKKMIPTTAIGGGSTSGLTGPYVNPTLGTVDYTFSGKCDVEITGGNVYACSFGGSAIGGGNISCRAGADANVTITGGNVIAKSVEYRFDGPTKKDTTLLASTAIGGGAAGGARGKKSGESGEDDDTDHYDGGTAIVKIGGSAIVTAGSVGGGSTFWPNGKVGSADIQIDGGETSAQFIMAKGAKSAPTFTMKGGFLKNSNTSDNEYVKIKPNGGAVYMESGTCTVSGGTISNCSATLGGAVYMNGGEFKMTGGTIADCEAKTSGGAVYIEGGNATVSGGEVYNNIASEGDGGGVYVKGGNFTMTGGKVNNNAAYENKTTHKYGNGAGIYVASTTSDPEVQLLGGEIANNSSDRNGGGLCVDMSETKTHKATITIGNVEVEKRDVYSPNIHNNKTALAGGGMSVQGKGSNITIYSGTVKGNVCAVVKNEDIRNDGGMVLLVGKNEEGKDPQVNVLYNTITFYANNEKDPEPYAEQRVITATNSPLDPDSAGALDFKMEFFHIASWNTKRDGTGTRYTADGTGAVMNISSDVSLYAQWVGN